MALGVCLWKVLPIWECRNQTNSGKAVRETGSKVKIL